MAIRGILLIFCLHVDYVLGYIDGAPVKACATMQPGHGVGGQESASPYTITTSSSTFRCKQDITVTVNSSTGTTPFKGFLCQARTDVDTYKTVGQLTSSGTVQTNNYCGSNIASLTHANNDNKTTILLNWRSNENATQIYIVCTIVQNRDTFWIKQASSAIMYQDGGDCDNGGTGGSTTVEPSTVTITLLIGLLTLKLP